MWQWSSLIDFFLDQDVKEPRESSGLDRKLVQLTHVIFSAASRPSWTLTRTGGIFKVVIMLVLVTG